MAALPGIAQAQTDTTALSQELKSAVVRMTRGTRDKFKLENTELI